MKFSFSLIHFYNSFVSDVQNPDSSVGEKIRREYDGISLDEAFRKHFRNFDDEFYRNMEEYFLFVFNEDIPVVTSDGIAHAETPMTKKPMMRDDLKDGDRKGGQKKKKKKKRLSINMS